MFDTLIRGGTVVDGTGRPAFAADVAVSGGRIAAIGDLSATSAAHVIDAAGRTVTPGFIDIHRITSQHRTHIRTKLWILSALIIFTNQPRILLFIHPRTTQVPINGSYRNIAARSDLRNLIVQEMIIDGRTVICR